MKEHIIYKCQRCGCIFSINTKYVTYAEQEHKYITCPLHGKHDKINIIGKREIRRLMEERNAVQL